eukprot:TRINITY_DN17057_c0_g2_i1.p1 TRINITY_DN17057_c0_g2~~TRINITY_DN17057_c0_g2_i1.p1  ORF type:complete len:503 (+),score=200.23 TRINITY_DN17057_c0_g2_i1:42-1511(+)
MPEKNDMWLHPAPTTDWAAIEKMLDGDGTEDKVLNGGLDEGYWGKGVGAHFWGQSECPTSRPIAGIVELSATDDWKRGSPMWAGKAKASKLDTHQKLTGAAWPRGAPTNIDSSRILSTIPAPPGQKNVVCGQAAFRGLYIAPLSGDSKEKVRKAVHDDFLADFGTNVHIHNMKSCARGTTFGFHVDASDKEVAALVDKIQRAFASMRAPTLKTLYTGFGVRPAGFTVDPNGCSVICRKKPLVRGDAQTGAASDDYDLGKAATGVKATRLAGYSAPAAASTPTRTPVKSDDKKPTPKTKEVENKKPLTPAEKRKALLGKVMHKTKVQLTEIESETPYVPATHELQKRKEALSLANAELAKEKKVSFEAAIAEAKTMLAPPSAWQGAIAKLNNKGRKAFENLELEVREFCKQTRLIIGRARVQNGLMDNTYEAKVKCVADKEKKGELNVVITFVDTGATLTGKIKGNVINGTYTHETVTGTFKLMRTENIE